MAARNGTRRKEDTRRECTDLSEIDKEATNVKLKGATDDDYTILNITRTGSTWTRVAAYKAGQEDNPNCRLCGEREESDHMWTCTELKEDRQAADEELAALNPEILHAAIKHGVAPAMSAKLQAT